MKKGLLVHVLRARGDCTAGGVTSKHDSFVLTGEGVPELFAPTKDAPELRLVRRDLNGEYLHAEPVERPVKMAGPMAGGNFVYSSDGRFPNRYPISVHDRFEPFDRYPEEGEGLKSGA